MGFDALKEQVCQANLDIVKSGLVLLTWGNVSGADRDAGVFAIKPSGVDYQSLTPDDIVVLSLETGEQVEGTLRPSSDTPTHLVLYREFGTIAGIVHTHSTYATSWAQAQREMPCLGTTHADNFHGAIPLTRQLTREDVEENYETNTGLVIVERFREEGLTPDEIPAVLVGGHGPFVWGSSVRSALENAVVLEEVARSALLTVGLNPYAIQLPQALIDKHFYRKHGSGAYYGQKI